MAGLRAAILAGRAADVVERGGAESGNATPHFFDEIGDQSVEHAVERFVHRLLRRCRGELRRSLVVESAEERDMVGTHLRRCKMPESRPSSKSAVR